MVEDESKLLWNEEESWSFPVLPVEENGGKILIEGGRIVTDAEIQGKKRSVSDEHIWTERERRKKMRNMFANLQEFIPNLHPRADKSTIVDEAVAHIKKLQETLEALEKQKEAKLKGEKSREAFLAEQGQLQPLPPPASTFRTWTSPNVVVNVCGYDAHINIVSSPRSKAGIITYVLFIMDKYNLDLVSAHVSSGIYMIHARANLIPQQFPEAAPFLVEETYKQLASDLIIWMIP